ncbi:MAG: hypothetical protein AVDCRST_MAG13-3057, partial [uncultured Solirubrobacteraceae bacterium]
ADQVHPSGRRRRGRQARPALPRDRPGPAARRGPGAAPAAARRVVPPRDGPRGRRPLEPHAPVGARGARGPARARRGRRAARPARL